MSFENNGSIFTSLKKRKERRSKFNLSHDVKLGLDMGNLCPVYLQECVPGDSIKINSTSMLRMAPLISPVMHKINVYLEYFFVPNRILWNNWETFITGSRNGKQLPAEELPAFPTVQVFNGASMPIGTSTLSDYLGIPPYETFPTGSEPYPTTEVSALPFAAYQRVWDEYYRDQNLIESMYEVETFDNYNMLFDGLQPQEVNQQLGALRPRCWEHDYFTSALPWAQKGEEVRIPVDIDGSGLELEFNYSGGTPSRIRNSDGSTISGPSDIQTVTSGVSAIPSLGVNDGSLKAGKIDITTHTDIVADSTALSGTINDLRAAIKLQEWLETNARGGSRYFESIYAHFGVKSPDSRLQRPEFIGSHRSNMIISEVLQTSSPQSDTDTPQGNMSGHGGSVSGTRDFSYYCQEHGYIIGILSVMPKTAYMQGIERHWFKTNDRLDYYFPEFAHLGEQEIYIGELYAGGSTASELRTTFGYTPRYSEYKFVNSRVAGDFRDTLKFWHLGRDFAASPVLNDSFVRSDPTTRIFAVQDLPASEQDPNLPLKDYNTIYAHVFHDVVASRLMPKYGTPLL